MPPKKVQTTVKDLLLKKPTRKRKLSPPRSPAKASVSNPGEEIPKKYLISSVLAPGVFSLVKLQDKSRQSSKSEEDNPLPENVQSKSDEANEPNADKTKHRKL
jgi:hypothetical protein